MHTLKSNSRPYRNHAIDTTKITQQLLKQSVGRAVGCATVSKKFIYIIWLYYYIISYYFSIVLS